MIYSGDYIEDLILANGEKNIFDFICSSSCSEIDFLITWRAMEALVEKGLVRCIGVSNVNSEQLSRLLKSCTIKPVINQVEVSLVLNQRKLIKYCKDNGIEVAAFSPLGRPNFETRTPEYIFDERLAAIGNKYGKSATQVILRYLVSHFRFVGMPKVLSIIYLENSQIQLGVIPIPRSQKIEHIQQNINLIDFKLNDIEMDALAQFNNGTHRCPRPKF